MTKRSRPATSGEAVRATYHPSRVPGLYCATLVDAGPPRARVHDRLILLTLTSGEALVRCRGEVHALRRGSLLMVEPGEVHRDLRKTAYRAVMVVLSAELVNAARGLGSGSCFGPVVTRSPALCADLVALVEAVREGRDLFEQESYASRLFAGLEPLWTRRPARPEPPLVTRVRRAFAESPEDTLSLEALAARLRCAPTYLCKVFTEHMGLGPHAYHLQYRLLRARTLVESGRTIAAAAAVAGFCDESHLYRHFRRRFAVAPGRYLKELTSLGESGPTPESTRFTPPS